MPQYGFNIPGVQPIGQQEPASAKEFDRMLGTGGSGGGRSTNALSQLMQLMRLRNMIDQQVRGRTKKERDEYDKQQNMGLAQNDVFRDAEYQQGYRDVQNLSAQKAIDKLGVLKKGVIERHAQARGVDPDALYKVMMGQLDAETRQYHKDVKEGKSFWGEVGTGIGEFWDAVRYAWETDPEKRNQIVKEAAEAEAKRVQANAYLRDQQLREAEGEGFIERGRGETGGFFANVGRGIGAMLPQIGIQLGARAGGAALGGMAGSAAGPAGTAIGGLAGAVFGGAVPGAAQAQYDFARRVMADPNLTDEEKQAALESGQWKATALGGALGAIPIGARDAARAIAPRIGQALGRGEAQELAKRAAIQEAERGWIGNIPRNTLWSLGELSAMMGGGVVGQNLIYGSATGQDIPAFEGMEEALAQGAVLAPIMGVASARPRFSRAQVAGWRGEGIAKFQDNIRAQIANDNFGGEATSKLVKEFKATYSRPDDLTQLLTGLEPEQRAVIRKAYGATPERVVQSTETTPSDRQLAARGVAEDEAVGTEKRRVDTSPSGRIRQVADAFDARETAPEAWAEVQRQSPRFAEHVEQVNSRLEELSAGVKDFYDRLRREPTAVKKDEIAAWLANQPDSEAFIKAREDLRQMLEDALGGKVGDIDSRILSYDKLRGDKYIRDNIIPVLKAFSGKKFTDISENNSPIENVRVFAKDKFKWSGEIKEQGAEDGGATTEIVGGNEPAGKADADRVSSEPDSKMATTTKTDTPKTTDEPMQQTAGDGEPAQVGGDGGESPQNIGQDKKNVPASEQPGVKPKQPGDDGGPSPEQTADPVPEESIGAGKSSSEDGGSPNVPRIEDGAGEEQPGTSVIRVGNREYRIGTESFKGRDQLWHEHPSRYDTELAIYMARWNDPTALEKWLGKKLDLNDPAAIEAAENKILQTLYVASTSKQIPSDIAPIWKRMEDSGIRRVKFDADAKEDLKTVRIDKEKLKETYARITQEDLKYRRDTDVKAMSDDASVVEETPQQPSVKVRKKGTTQEEVPTGEPNLAVLKTADGRDKLAAVLTKAYGSGDNKIDPVELLPGQSDFNDALYYMYLGLTIPDAGDTAKAVVTGLRKEFPEFRNTFFDADNLKAELQKTRSKYGIDNDEDAFRMTIEELMDKKSVEQNNDDSVSTTKTLCRKK